MVRLDLEEIGEPTVVAVQSDTDEYTSAGDDTERRAKQARLQEWVYDVQQDREERKTYANRIFSLISWWLFGVFFIVLFCSIESVRISHSDAVLVALLTTTTVNVVGLFVIVAKYLFRDHHDGT